MTSLRANCFASEMPRLCSSTIVTSGGISWKDNKATGYFTRDLGLIQNHSTCWILHKAAIFWLFYLPYHISFWQHCNIVKYYISGVVGQNMSISSETNFLFIVKSANLLEWRATFKGKFDTNNFKFGWQYLDQTWSKPSVVAQLILIPELCEQNSCHIYEDREVISVKGICLHGHKYLLALSSYGEEEQQQHGRGTLGFPHWVPEERQYFILILTFHRYTINNNLEEREEEHIPHILKQYISIHGFSYLVEFEFKAKNVAKRERFAHVGLNQRQEKFVLISSALVHLQDYVQHAVWVQVETSCRQKEQANRSRWIKKRYIAVL